MIRRRVRGLLGGIVVIALMCVAVAVDVDRRRARWKTQEPARLEAARTVGVPGLALNSASRWLRHPVVSEPHAAQADAPLAFDSDPAGSLLGPPETRGGTR